jgi:hypothetical protein
VGSVAALEVMEILKENIITNHPLEVIILPMKSGTIGSIAMVGH